jgi:hypothetical protein
VSRQLRQCEACFHPFRYSSQAHSGASPSGCGRVRGHARCALPRGYLRAQLNWGALASCPDIVFAVATMARFSTNPGILSTTESEYVVVTHDMKEGLWLRNLLHFGNARPGRPERQRAQARRAARPHEQVHTAIPRGSTLRLKNSSHSLPFDSFSLFSPLQINSRSNQVQARPNPLSTLLGARTPFSPLSFTSPRIAFTPLSFQTVLRSLRRCFSLCMFYFLVFTSVLQQNV